jgi:hypothetical protein
MISASILADSICNGHRITTMRLQYPRFIHSEMCRHRMFSRNTASSRAIPFEKMLEAVQENPVIPIAWQKNHKGMQGTEYLDETQSDWAKMVWLSARDKAIHEVEDLSHGNVTKQIINRLLEPWMWTVEIVTATEWENLFHLRCPQYRFPAGGPIFRSWDDLIKYTESQEPKASSGWIEDLKNFTILQRLEWNKGQAEIHMMAIAEAMWDQYNSSIPRELKPGEWHIPYGDTIKLYKDEKDPHGLWNLTHSEGSTLTVEMGKVQIATAMLAQTSYTVVGEDGKPMSYENLIDLHNSLLIRPYTNRKGVVFGPDDPIHASPAEHCAQAMTEKEIMYYTKTYGVPGKASPQTIEHGWCHNYRGFKSYRSMIPNENRR